MLASKFDIKHMIRCMVSTKAYQRSSRTTAKNAADHELYSHMTMKVLPPRSLFHSMGDDLRLRRDDFIHTWKDPAEGPRGEQPVPPPAPAAAPPPPPPAPGPAPAQPPQQ